MDHIESICPSDKLVSLSKPRILPNLDKTLIVEVDVVLTTLVFQRKDDAIDAEKERVVIGTDNGDKE